MLQILTRLSVSISRSFPLTLHRSRRCRFRSCFYKRLQDFVIAICEALVASRNAGRSQSFGTTSSERESSVDICGFGAIRHSASQQLSARDTKWKKFLCAIKMQIKLKSFLLYAKLKRDKLGV